jgi:hypothetical protein
MADVLVVAAAHVLPASSGKVMGNCYTKQQNQPNHFTGSADWPADLRSLSAKTSGDCRQPSVDPSAFQVAEPEGSPHQVALRRPLSMHLRMWAAKKETLKFS